MARHKVPQLPLILSTEIRLVPGKRSLSLASSCSVLSWDIVCLSYWLRCWCNAVAGNNRASRWFLGGQGRVAGTKLVDWPLWSITNNGRNILGHGWVPGITIVKRLCRNVCIQRRIKRIKRETIEAASQTFDMILGLGQHQGQGLGDFGQGWNRSPLP